MSRGIWPTLRPETPARVEFGAALAEHRIPCAEADAWTSDDPDERAAAAEACQPCPLAQLCHEAAGSTAEAWGVWAGRDHSPTKTKSTRRTA